MTSTYTANQGIEKPGTGDQSGTWGATVNTNMDIIDRTVSGVGALTLTGTTTTLTTTDGTLTDGMYRVLVLGDGGDLGGDNTITLSPNDQDKTYLVYNNLSANRSAIFTQGTGANATVQNGETAWIYADGAGGGAVVRSAVSSVKIADQDGDTQIQIEEGGDDDDTIRFDLAGAEDFTMTANTFNVLSGSDLNINSGGTITNAGTANGFGADAERAMAGVLQANANFVDQVIFGPSVDGVAWNGAWSKASVFSSLMLATIEDEGSNTEINIWDLTEQTTGVISTTPLATVDLSAAATPTSIAAAMGYLIVGSEDGIAIIDPHSGAWAERTIGWPRTLSTSSTPPLGSNAVSMVAAAVAGTSTFDPRTGGFLPTFAALFASGDAKTGSVIMGNGNVWDILQAAPATGVIGFHDYDLIWPRNATDTRRWEVERIDADFNSYRGDSYQDIVWPQGFAATTAFSASGIHSAWASTSGTTFRLKGDNVYLTGMASITRAYNTGYLVGDIRGAWLANSKTVDRSYKANTLTENGTVTEGAVESSAELNGYSGFSTSNYLSRASDADWDVIGTGAFSVSIWAKTAGNSAKEAYVTWSNAGQTVEVRVHLDTGGNIDVLVDGATAQVGITGTRVIDDGAWHKIDLVNVSSTERHLYIDGTIDASDTTDTGSISDSGNMPLRIGLTTPGTSFPATSSTLSLARFSLYAPPASLVRQMYDGEKGMFVASAECLLQSGSTDAVLDVNVDPLSSKVLVTQTDAITVFDGLAIDSKPTVNSGASEKGKLWGALRAEQNSANAYVTAPATDQRQVNEVVRGLASDLPAGVDLSKAKAWVVQNSNTSSPNVYSSYNIESVTLDSTGIYKVTFAVPFGGPAGTSNVAWAGFASANYYDYTSINVSTFVSTNKFAQVTTHYHDGVNYNSKFMAVFFGELANE
tara:strand:- start:44 stop:2818 length:2775 start_codon:yes stop_codon:yes gene_type:complete